MRSLSGVGRLFLAVALGVSSLCLSPSSARAEDVAKANVLAEAAAARVSRGERRVAIDLYEEAYAAAPRREYLRAIAALYETLALARDPRDLRLAILYYERFLVEEGQTPERAALETRLGQLRVWKARMPSEPMPQIASRVPLHLLAYNNTLTYGVTVGDERCVTPCTLTLPPGPARLKTSGAGELSMDVVVPPRPSQIRLQHSDSTAFTAGAVLLPSGLLVGASLWALVFTCGSSACELLNLTVWPVLGGSAFITGIVLLAMGKVTPANDANRVELVARGGAPRPRLTSFGVAPAVGGATGGLRFEF